MLTNLRTMYGPRLPWVMSALYRAENYSVWRLLGRFWTTQNFGQVPLPDAQQSSGRSRLLIRIVQIGMLLQAAVGLWLVYLGLVRDVVGYAPLGAAIFVSYTVVWAHMFAVFALAAKLAHPKRFGREIVCHILESQVRVLRARHTFTVVAVVGSVGKTSTKLAIAALLSQSKRVIYQEGNYNDRVTVPLVLFGQREPSLTNVFAWIRLFLRNHRQLRRDYPYDIAVLELGTDGPGQIEQFAYLKPDLTVITAVVPEHMEYFGTLDAVAHEELTAARFSARVLANHDDIEPKYLATIKGFTTYGLAASNDYYATFRQSTDVGTQKVNFHLPHATTLDTNIHYLGAQGVKVALAAVAVADMLQLPHEAVKAAVQGLQPFSGRMQVLAGMQDTTLIDDTYNASPVAVTAALDVLYALKAPQRIAILGSMNELGETSPEAHRQVGSYCDPAKLDLVVTIGRDAEAYLAPAAVARGCRVKTFRSPYEAGAFVKKQMQPSAVVLAKGSQNGVFAEEALKSLLADQSDTTKLVRQSAYWLKVKRSQFGD